MRQLVHGRDTHWQPRPTRPVQGWEAQSPPPSTSCPDKRTHMPRTHAAHACSPLPTTSPCSGCSPGPRVAAAALPPPGGHVGTHPAGRCSPAAMAGKVAHVQGRTWGVHVMQHLAANMGGTRHQRMPFASCTVLPARMRNFLRRVAFSAMPAALRGTSALTAQGRWQVGCGGQALHYYSERSGGVRPNPARPTSGLHSLGQGMVVHKGRGAPASAVATALHASPPAPGTGRGCKREAGGV